MRSTLGDRLPEVPWDLLRPYKERAAAHSGGLIDLSMGGPVDPVAEVIRSALARAADAPGYPPAAGTPAVHDAVVAWAARILGVPDLDPSAVVPAIGLKEMVAWLPTLLGVGSGDRVVIPELSYPTYEIGAVIAGAEVVRSDSTVGLGPAEVCVIWVNSPSNPTGRVLGRDHLRKMVRFARERDAVLISDECYLELGWSEDPAERPISILHPDICGGDHRNLLALHSLSKRSNLAGYRAGVALGDPALIAGLTKARRHAGFIVPAPVQSAMVAAFTDDEHVRVQWERYRRRRSVLLDALQAAGFTVDNSEAGLYLWVSRGESSWDTVAWLAERGILVAPGDFYGPSGGRHVRVALTASDEAVAAAGVRIRG